MSEEQSKALAKLYYGVEHVNAMCALKNHEIVANLRPVCAFLEAQVAARERDGDSAWVGDSAEDLLSEEYVLFSTPREFSWDWNPPTSEIDLGKDDFGLGEWGDLADQIPGYEEGRALLTDFDARCYPSGGVDDWYERTGGISTCGILLKSTGESFSDNERRLLAEAVVHNVMANGRGEGGGTLFLCEFTYAGRSANQAVVSVLIDGEVYVGQLVEGVAGMGSEVIAKLVAVVFALGSDVRTDLPSEFLSLVKRYSKMMRPSPTDFKRKLTALLGSYTDKEEEDANPMLAIEDILRPYLFNGRPYYHGRNSVEFYEDC